MLISKIEILQILPCIADPEKIRIIAEFDNDIREIFPYLNAIIDDAIYNPNFPTINFKKEERMITLYPKQAFVAKVNDEKDAKEICEWLKNLINDTYFRKDEITPSYERKKKLSPSDIYKLLPQTNCKRCGEIKCFAFAFKVAKEEKNIILCSELFSGNYNEKRDLLLQLLKSAGYSIPDF
jgi:ArsR family metal-binding transcriptional regulator